MSLHLCTFLLAGSAEAMKKALKETETPKPPTPPDETAKTPGKRKKMVTEGTEKCQSKKKHKEEKILQVFHL